MIQIACIGITATQQGMTPAQLRSASWLFETLGCVEMHHGDYIGGDEQANDVFDVIGHSIVIHSPIVSAKRAWCAVFNAVRHNRAPRPYLARNHDIVDETQGLVAGPREESGEELRSGTWATIRYARKLKRPVFVVRPSGAIEVEGVEGVTTLTCPVEFAPKGGAR